MKNSSSFEEFNFIGKKTDSLIFKFAVIFAVFTLAAIILCGAATYFLQNGMYRRQVEERVSGLADYLTLMLSDQALDFPEHQKYLMEHSDEVLIPFDYDYNYAPALHEFERLFAEEFPGKTYGTDISFDQLTDELKRARAVYVQEYCLNLFEQTMPAFNVSYTYYLVPDEAKRECCFVIDGTRIEREYQGGSYISLGEYFDESLEKVPVLWKVWEAKTPLHEFDVYNNEYGHTYGYYSPLIIDGEALGLIAIDVEVDSVNSVIIRNVLRLCLFIALVLILCVVVLLFFINRRYIRKLEHLVSGIKQYTSSKNAEIAEVIGYDVNSKDEISALANQTAAMILELDKYMKNLVNTTKELSETRQQAKDLQALANRDSLTGIRNKTGYDDEIRKLQRETVQGFDKFGIAIADLNDLRALNEEFGHDKGNQAIKKLCRLVCNTFKHSPVFRIGGDEFAVILKNGDFEIVDELVKSFDSEMEKMRLDDLLDPWERPQAAVGVALFDPELDFTVEDVFKRAEAAMADKKREMKEG